MSRARDLFMKATFRSMCFERDCDDCHNVYGTNDCPDTDNVTLEEAAEFVKRVMERLDEVEAVGNYTGIDVDVTEDELIDILLGAANE